MLKQFVVRKFIMAESASQAIKIESDEPVHDVYVDDGWKKNQPSCIVEGFKVRD